MRVSFVSTVLNSIVNTSLKPSYRLKLTKTTYLDWRICLVHFVKLNKICNIFETDKN